MQQHEIKIKNKKTRKDEYKPNKTKKRHELKSNPKKKTSCSSYKHGMSVNAHAPEREGLKGGCWMNWRLKEPVAFHGELLLN